MIIRQLKQTQYDLLQRKLIQTGEKAPLEACYTVSMKIDGFAYVIKIQPECKRRMAMLQAYKSIRDHNGLHFDLITEGVVLKSLFEIFLYQGVE